MNRPSSQKCQCYPNIKLCETSCRFVLRSALEPSGVNKGPADPVASLVRWTPLPQSYRMLRLTVGSFALHSALIRDLGVTHNYGWSQLPSRWGRGGGQTIICVTVRARSYGLSATGTGSDFVYLFIFRRVSRQ